MAIVAVIAACYVGRMLANGRRTIVARTACSKDLRMVDRIHWLPDIRVVAILANICRLHMLRALAGRVDAVVTVAAISGDIHVIEICRYPAGRRVAVFTIVAAVEMCSVLAGRCNTVVARRTGTNCLRVIKKCRYPGRRGMTIVTCIAAIDMCRRLALCCDIIVAGSAGAGHLRVVDGIHG